jgi:two-component system, OmpR family, alkaline phosphatase synthesis response regulator PhoP
MATILAVDKDTLQLEVLSHLLQQEGHKVHATAEPERALDLLQTQLIDLVVVEPSLPRHDSVRICQQMRQLNPYTPLLVLSERREEDQIVRTLLAAADDYVVKPFSPRYLLARVTVLLRRSNLNRGGRWVDENLSIGEISLNLQQAQVLVSGQRIGLTQREFSLLYALMENAGRVLTRDQLTELAWDHFAGGPKSVDVYVQRLRKKLHPHLDGREYIQALRGFGYKFEIPRPQTAAVR